MMTYVLVFSACITLIVSAVHFSFDYRREMRELANQFRQIETSHMKSVETPLRRLDHDHLTTLINGILSLRDVVYVEIEKDGDIISKAGTSAAESPVSREFPIFLNQDDQQLELGTLRVTATYKGIYLRLLEKLGLNILESAIIVFSVAIFIFFFVQESFTKHLVRISNYAKEIDQSLFQPPLILSRRKADPNRIDELDEVVHSIEEMQRNLQAGYRALVASEGRLKIFAEAASDWLWEMDAQLKYTYVSDRFFEITGFNPINVIGCPQTELYEGPADNPEWRQHLEDLNDRKPFRDFALSLSNPNGETHWLRISGRPIFDESGQFDGYRGTGTDITNEVRAREEAIETTLRFLDAIENVSEGIAFWDSDDRFVLCNRIFRSQAGAAAHLLVRGTPFEDYMRGLLAAGAISKKQEDREQWLDQRIKERKIQTAPVEVYRDGKWLLIRDGHSSDGSTVSVSTDITEVKQREQQLQQVTDAVPILLAYVDDELRYQMINKEYEEWFNLSRQLILGSKIENTLPHLSYEQMEPHIKTALAGKFVRFQLTLPYTAKKTQSANLMHHLEFSYTPNFDRQGKASGFFVAAIDVTDLVESEEGARKGERALSEQTQILRASFEAMLQGISIWDENRKLMIWNKTFEQFMRFPKGFLRRGMSLRQALVKAATIGNFGSQNPKDLAADWIRNLTADDQPAHSNLKFADGQMLVVERYGMADGGFISMLTDITEQTRAQEQLQHTQKIEAVGQLTGGIAHDFNNLLAIIIGSLNLMEDRVEDERAKKLVNSALRAARRGAELTQRLLAFGRRQALITEHTNVNELVEGILELLARTLGVGVKVISKLGHDLWSMDVDRGQLENALLNLAINARDAMPDGGVLTIETANILLGTDYARRHQDVEPGAFVMISVTDSGVGMSPEVVERAIEPFFTTKKVGAGSGLGLSMIYGFANQSGGHMSIYSEPGHGTNVRIYLPASEGDVIYSEASNEYAGYVSNGEHILVIEDDEDVRFTTAHILTDLGYTVTEAANASEAMAAVDSGTRIDLVFSDVFLQESENGPAIVKKIRALVPDMKILFTSGYTADQFEESNFQEDSMAFIPKPFEINALAIKLREIFDGKSSTSA